MKAIRAAYGEALKEIGAQRQDVVVLDADLAHATNTFMFAGEHKDRFFNMGIAEQNMIGTAAGLAISGFIPVASTFAMFGSGRAYEQVRNTVCYPKLNVKLAMTHSGITVGEDGGSHQTIEDISLMRGIPNMTVIVPCDAVEMKKALLAALDFQGPVYLRIARPPSAVFTDANTKFEIGKANVLKDGSDIAIFATGIMVYQALLAAEELEKQGVSAAVINVHTIKPLDKETVVAMAKKTGKVITVEEHSVIGGLGSAIAETVSEEAPCKLKRIGVQDMFGQSGTPEQLLAHYGLTAENIVKTAKDMVK